MSLFLLGNDVILSPSFVVDIKVVRASMLISLWICLSGLIRSLSQNKCPSQQMRVWMWVFVFLSATSTLVISSLSSVLTTFPYAVP